MKRIALLTATALAMAIPAAAYAWPIGPMAEREEQPRVYYRDRDAGWTRERYDRYEDSHWARDFRSRWVPLARGYSAQTDRQFIHVSGMGRFRRVRIEAVRGEPVILQIAIEFMDKTTQVVKYREAFPAGTGEVIDLNGGARRINRIIVYTDPRSRGVYSVYGA